MQASVPWLDAVNLPRELGLALWANPCRMYLILPSSRSFGIRWAVQERGLQHPQPLHAAGLVGRWQPTWYYQYTQQGLSRTPILLPSCVQARERHKVALQEVGRGSGHLVRGSKMVAAAFHGA